MCGIAGFFLNQSSTAAAEAKLRAASKAMHLRGPDHEGFFFHQQVGLAHRRLSIIDTSAAANQPFSIDQRYQIIFNGEIFNYKELKSTYLANTQCTSTSDTEILLRLFIQYGPTCLEWLNGFFVFCIYDQLENKIVLARDRYGKKPLLFTQTAEGIFFASELKGLLAFGIKKELDEASLSQYFQLNYLPPNQSMLKGVEKLAAGTYAFFDGKQLSIQPYYQLQSKPKQYQHYTYEQAQKQLITLMTAAVERRLVSDVPLGAFLSGGIDSSVIVALASNFKKQLHTFSIGYKDEPFFDETKYAELVANKYQTEHTVFKLSNDDFLTHLQSVLDYIDEPFADSSALAVYILSHETRKHVTVALSGDGADEIFAGYNKYAAEFKMRKGGFTNSAVKALHPLWAVLPKSRNHKITNLFRQFNRFADGARLPIAERHYQWCCLLQEHKVQQLLAGNSGNNSNELKLRKQQLLSAFTPANDFNEVLLTDMNLVLKGDMLVKVDSMSMANSLEIRSPFLDHTVVDFAFSLPSEYKINSSIKKRIVQDAFRSLLPPELYQRPKHGFEVPLLKWFRKELRSKIENDWLNDVFIADQKIFNVLEVQQLKKQLWSNNPGDAAATVWAIIVFQNWWKKYFC
jgi:asparagine synthase (glutamine-hydrolysing)